MPSRASKTSHSCFVNALLLVGLLQLIGSTNSLPSMELKVSKYKGWNHSPRHETRGHVDLDHLLSSEPHVIAAEVEAHAAKIAADYGEEINNISRTVSGDSGKEKITYHALMDKKSEFLVYLRFFEISDDERKLAYLGLRSEFGPTALLKYQNGAFNELLDRKVKESCGSFYLEDFQSVNPRVDVNSSCRSFIPTSPPPHLGEQQQPPSSPNSNSGALDESTTRIVCEVLVQKMQMEISLTAPVELKVEISSSSSKGVADHAGETSTTTPQVQVLHYDGERGPNAMAAWVEREAAEVGAKLPTPMEFHTAKLEKIRPSKVVYRAEVGELGEEVGKTWVFFRYFVVDGDGYAEKVLDGDIHRSGEKKVYLGTFPFHTPHHNMHHYIRQEASALWRENFENYVIFDQTVMPCLRFSPGSSQHQTIKTPSPSSHAQATTQVPGEGIRLTCDVLVVAKKKRSGGM